jgi:tetratricopeptide (TPR) repeat protein
MSQISTLVALLSSITILCNNNNNNGLWIEASSLSVSTSSDDGPIIFSPTLSCAPEDDGSMMCQFRIIESSPDGQKETFDVAFEDCPMGYDYCIQAKVSGKFIRKEEEQPPPPRQDEEESMTNTAENTGDAANEEMSTRNKSEEQIVRVRLATYRPPWSQYGEHVAERLAKQPTSTFLATTTAGGSSSSSSFLNLDQGTMTWANWYFDVGSAHLLQYQSNPDLDWYEMELALNAYQHVVTTLLPEASPSSPPRSNQKERLPGSFLLQALSLSSTSRSGTTIMLQTTFERYLSRDNLLASVYFQMGQWYLMHPDQTQMAEALTSFQMALHIYTELRMAVQTIFAVTDAVVTLEIHPHDERTIQLQWASTASTISSILVSVAMSEATVGPTEQPQVTQQMTLLLDGLSANLNRIKPQQQEKQSSSQLDGSLTLQNALAETLLENALHIYRRYLTNDSERSTFTMEELAQTQTSFATALQSAAALASAHGRLEESKTWLLEALQILDEHVLPFFDDRSVELETYIISKADNLLTLAGVWLSLGDYDEAKHYYRTALEFYEHYNVEVSPLSLESYSLMVDPNSSGEEGMGHDDDILQSHVDALEEYHARVEGGRGGSRKSRNKSSILDGAGGGAHADDFYYERNDRYEAELHGNLGSLYLSRGEVERSRGHLEAALGLCGESSDGDAKEHTPSDVCSDRQVAEVKLNLAAALFHLRLFSNSIQRHFEALDIYYSLYGPGVNPILQAMEEYGLVVDDVFGVGEHQQRRPEGGVREEENGAGTAGSSSKSGNERFIDIGRFKQTVTNVTAGTSSSTHEEEL